MTERSRIRDTIVEQSDEQYSPPGQNVLSVSVIGDDVFLTIAKHDEDGTTTTMTTVAQVVVPLRDLFVAIHGQTATAGWLGTLLTPSDLNPAPSPSEGEK